MPLNPNAGSFSFSPGAAAFTPSFASAPAAPAAPPAKAADDEEEIVLAAPAAAPPAAPAAPAEDAALAGCGDDGEEDEDDEEIDENDPLWKAFLKLALGDVTKAKEMLLDPDQYMDLPEIAAALEAGGEAGDKWDDAPVAPSGGGGGGAEEPAAPPAAPTPAAPAAPAAAQAEAACGGGGGGGGGAAEDDDEGRAVTEAEEMEADPREHLNLVFIGHVDAGKSTLSGNILFLTDMVDKRMIEKFEREAKQRNRDSWFLAFIMDTSEEERAKGKTVEVGRAHFSTAEKRFTVLDAPGHKS